MDTEEHSVISQQKHKWPRGIYAYKEIDSLLKENRKFNGSLTKRNGLHRNK